MSNKPVLILNIETIREKLHKKNIDIRPNLLSWCYKKMEKKMNDN